MSLHRGIVIMLIMRKKFRAVARHIQLKLFSGKFRRIHRKALVMDSRGFWGVFWRGVSFFNNGAGRRAT